MSRHEFTLIVDGPDLQDESAIAALYEAGCDDASVGRVGQIQYLDFTREADSFPDAVASAIENIENAIPEARVVYMEPDDLVTISDIAERARRTRESVRLLISGERGPGGFPPPATHFRSRQRMWRWQRVAAWLAKELGDPQVVGDPGTAQFITALNATLTLREMDPRLPPSEREQLRRLVG